MKTQFCSSFNKAQCAAISPKKKKKGKVECLKSFFFSMKSGCQRDFF